MMSSNESSDDVNLKDPTGFLNLDEFGTHPNVFRTIHYPLLSTCLLPSHLPLELSVDDTRIRHTYRHLLLVIDFFMQMPLFVVPRFLL